MPDFSADPREPQTFIEEASERAFRGGFWTGLIAGGIISGLLTALLFI